MRNYQLSTAINEYPADDDVLTMLHASELVQGRRIVALYIHVSFSPDKTQAGYMLMGKIVSLERGRRHRWMSDTGAYRGDVGRNACNDGQQSSSM